MPHAENDEEKNFVLLGSLNVCVYVHAHVHHPVLD